MFPRIYNYLFPPLDPEMKAGIREMRPFFWLVMGALAFLYGWSLYFQPDLRQTGRLIPLTLLMLIHAAIHWYVPYFAVWSGRGIVYVLVQTVLAFSIMLVGKNLSLVYGLSMGLIGESLGVFGLTPLGGLSVAVFMGISAAGYLIIEGWASFWVWALTGIPLMFFVIVYVVMFGRQISLREQAQTLLKDLEQAHRQLAEYAIQVEDLTLAAERQRMARELHDALSQGLAGLVLQLEAASAHLENQQVEKAQSVLVLAMAQARQSLDHARRTISDLRKDEDAGVLDLSQALKDEVQRFQSATGISCDLEISMLNEISEVQRETAYRMVAECLTNTARHAEAHRAWVKTGFGGDQFTIEVGDDGKGFIPEDVIGMDRHYGLLGLRERARIAGGSLQIESQPGLGTVMRMTLPVEVSTKE